MSFCQVLNYLNHYSTAKILQGIIFHEINVAEEEKRKKEKRTIYYNEDIHGITSKSIRI